MIDPTTINANLAKCIQASTNFGNTTYYNVCNNTTSVVPWGAMDYVACLGLIALGVAFIMVLLAITRDIMSH
jgi:hypothetical protein